LTCTFDGNVATVQVILSTTTTGQITTSTSSFIWHVLETLVDGVVLEQVPPTLPEKNWMATITLTKALQAGS
jgi:serine/threonine-protein kinase RsbW